MNWVERTTCSGGRCPCACGTMKAELLPFSGREGYMTLLNSDVRKELDHLAAFFRMAIEHKKKIGFRGQLLIEPKPKEPTKHQCNSIDSFQFPFFDHR